LKKPAAVLTFLNRFMFKRILSQFAPMSGFCPGMYCIQQHHFCPRCLQPNHQHNQQGRYSILLSAPVVFHRQGIQPCVMCQCFQLNHFIWLLQVVPILISPDHVFSSLSFSLIEETRDTFATQRNAISVRTVVTTPR